MPKHEVLLSREFPNRRLPHDQGHDDAEYDGDYGNGDQDAAVRLLCSCKHKVADSDLQHGFHDDVDPDVDDHVHVFIVVVVVVVSSLLFLL